MAILCEEEVGQQTHEEADDEEEEESEENPLEEEEEEDPERELNLDELQNQVEEEEEDKLMDVEETKEYSMKTVALGSTQTREPTLLNKSFKELQALDEVNSDLIKKTPMKQISPRKNSFLNQSHNLSLSLDSHKDDRQVIQNLVKDRIDAFIEAQIQEYSVGYLRSCKDPSFMPPN